MAYIVKVGKEMVTYAECPECESKLILQTKGSIICTDCGFVIYEPKKKENKYHAVKTVAKDGLKRDSKFEASVADELYAKKAAGEILDYDSQYRVEIPIYNEHGKLVHKVFHKVDYRTHNRDGTFTLLEAKGVETSDYKFRRKLLGAIWLPEHLDHEYEVRKQAGWRRKR